MLIHVIVYRCINLAEFEGEESKMTTLISAAVDTENISRIWTQPGTPGLIFIAIIVIPLSMTYIVNFAAIIIIVITWSGYDSIYIMTMFMYSSYSDGNKQ